MRLLKREKENWSCYHEEEKDVSTGILYANRKRKFSPMKSEKAIQNEIMLALSQNGCRVFRSNAGEVKTADGRVVKLMPKGFPDITGFRISDGKFLAIEVKNEKGSLRDDQIKFGEFLNKHPVLYGVARSVEEALEIVMEVN